MLNTHLNLDLRLRISESIPPFPHMHSRNVQEQLYLFTVNYCIGETLGTL